MALKRFAHGENVDVVWRAFELDPAAPSERSPRVPYTQRLSEKYGTSEDQAQAMIDRMTDTAKADGLELNFERIRPGNTFNAHRVLHLAQERGLQDAVKEALFRAYLTEGLPIGDPATVARVAIQAGLAAEDVEAVLSSELLTDAVRADEQEASTLGIRGVPFFVIGGKIGLSGAQPSDVLLEALEQAWKEGQPAWPQARGEGRTPS